MDSINPRWTEQDVADYLSCSRDTVRRMRLDGTGPPYSALGSRPLYRYDPDEVREWERAGSTRHTADTGEPTRQGGAGRLSA